MDVLAGIIFTALQQGTLPPVILSVFDRRALRHRVFPSPSRLPFAIASSLRHRVFMDTLTSRGAPV
jgi:hypothetical protein